MLEWQGTLLPCVRSQFPLQPICPRDTPAMEQAGWDTFSIYTFACRGCWESLSLIKDLNKHIAGAVIKLLSFVREGAGCQQFVDLDI